MTYNTKKLEKKRIIRIWDYNNSSRRLRPLGSRVMALSIKSDPLPLRTESRELNFLYCMGLTTCQCENG